MSTDNLKKVAADIIQGEISASAETRLIAAHILDQIEEDNDSGARWIMDTIVKGYGKSSG